MPRPGGEVKCPICFESLFNSLDDLDDALPAVVTECGHGFHKPCIEQWFKSQAEAYVAMMEPRQSDYEDPITTADAPAICPSCREECFADAETGEVNLIRMFFATEDRADASSQIAGSSPVRPMSKSDKAASGELMGLARRAKTITANVAGFDTQVDERCLNGMLDRAEGLTQDVASAKAIQAVKRYIGGLTSAINTFRSQLKESPLPAMLRAQLEIAKSDVEAAKNETRMLRIKRLEPEIQRAETACYGLKLSQKKVRQLSEDLDETKKSLKEVQTTSAAQIKNWREALELTKSEKNEAIDRATKAEEDAKTRGQDLNERTRQLKSYKAKNTELRTRYEDMEQENKRLLQALTQVEGMYRTSVRKLTDGDAPQKSDRLGSADTPSPSLNTSPPVAVKPSVKRALVEADPDESLSIEMPSFEDSTRISASSSRPAVVPTSKVPRARQHPTARTFQFDVDAESSHAPRKKSKYFPTDHARLSSGLSGDITRALTALSDNDHGDDDDDEPRVIVPATSPLQRPVDVNRSRTNPFQTTRQESVAKTNAKLKRKPVETIEIGDSTDGDSPLKPANINVSASMSANSGDARKAPVPSRTQSMTSYLGLADRAGRPLKNIASGSKVKRRA